MNSLLVGTSHIVLGSTYLLGAVENLYLEVSIKIWQETLNITKVKSWCRVGMRGKNDEDPLPPDNW